MAKHNGALPLFPQNPILFPEADELFALVGREASLAVGAIRAGALHPLAQGCFGQIDVAGHTAHALALVEHESERLALKSSSNRRRGRRLELSAIRLDIVSIFRKMSTRPDQVQGVFNDRRRE